MRVSLNMRVAITLPAAALLTLPGGCIMDVGKGQMHEPRCPDGACAAEDPHDPEPDGIDPGDQEEAEPPAEADLPDETDAVCQAGETDCGDGRDDDCDGKTDCRDEECEGHMCDDGLPCTYEDRCAGGACAGAPIECESGECVDRACNGTQTCTQIPLTGDDCDDADPCTYGDRCNAGACAATPVVCASDPCATRSCDGTSTCNLAFSPAGTPCTEDGNPCTLEQCDGGGACVSRAAADGASCGEAYEERCCGGACTNIFASDAHCGGCGTHCDGRGCAILPGTSFAGCRCTFNSECLMNGPAWTCYDPGSGYYCNCHAAEDCAPGQTCQQPSGHNYCLY